MADVISARGVSAIFDPTQVESHVLLVTKNIQKQVAFFVARGPGHSAFAHCFWECEQGATEERSVTQSEEHMGRIAISQGRVGGRTSRFFAARPSH